MTVLFFKHLLHQREGIPEDQQRIISSGRQLENSHTLGNYIFQENPTVHLRILLKGC